MKIFIIVIVGALVALAQARSELEMRHQWEAYKKEYGKTYVSLQEELNRYQVWKGNVERVTAHNARAAAGLHSYWLGVNHFADLTVNEFRAIYNKYKHNVKDVTITTTANGIFNYNSTLQVAASVDWRTQGYVTPIKNQGKCGSCWAFSTTGALEGQHFKATGKLVSLSEQNLMDCSGSYGNGGCDGGMMDQAFGYVIDNKGVDTEESYPYQGVEGTCNFNSSNVGATIREFFDVESMNEKALQQAVATVGPVSVAIDASHDSFMLYSHGVYSESQCGSTEDDLDHGVLVVGYGTDDQGNDYWIVKNSWSTKWGMQGYVLMSRNQNNQCGIATIASYPTV